MCSPDVFISYSHAPADKTIAGEIARALSRQGLQVWQDRGSLTWGDSLPGEIARAISSSRYILLCLSPGFAESDCCSAELELAVSLARQPSANNKPQILPLIIAGGEETLNQYPLLPATNCKPYQGNANEVALWVLALGNEATAATAEQWSPGCTAPGKQMTKQNADYYRQFESKTLDHDRREQIAMDVASIIPALQSHRKDHIGRLREARRSAPKFANKNLPAWVRVSTTASPAGHRLIIGFRNKTCAYRDAEELGLGCFNCGYYAGTGDERPARFGELLQQLHYGFSYAFKSGRSFDVIEFLGDGSFLNDGELAEPVKRRLFKVIASMPYIRRVLVESTPEHVVSQPTEVPDRLATLRDDQRLEIGIGLETTDDFVRRACINKGFSLDAFCKAVREVKRLNECCQGRCAIVAYVLVKPAFLTTPETIDNVMQTLRDLSALSKEYEVPIIPKLEPAAIADGTLLSLLYQEPPEPRLAYSPLNYWAVLELITRVYLDSQCSDLFAEMRVGAREDMDDVIKVPAVYSNDGRYDQFDFILDDAIQQFNQHHNIFKLYATIKGTYPDGLDRLFGGASSYSQWVNTELAAQESVVRPFMERNVDRIQSEMDDRMMRLEASFLGATYGALDLIEDRDPETVYVDKIRRLVRSIENPIGEDARSELARIIHSSFPQATRPLVDIYVIDAFKEPEGLLRIFFEARDFVSTRRIQVWSEVPLSETPSR